MCFGFTPSPLWSSCSSGCCCTLCPADGTISSSSILLAQSTLHNLQGQSCSPTDLFYQGNAQPIREWLTVAITRAMHQGEDSLLELTKQICCFLQVRPTLSRERRLEGATPLSAVYTPVGLTLTCFLNAMRLNKAISGRKLTSLRRVTEKLSLDHE